MACTKTKTYRRQVDAKIALALLQGRSARGSNRNERKEKGWYYCTEHKGYHLKSNFRS